MENSEKILTNCDVLQLIFHYLDFKEHLKLLKISPQFEYAIVHGVWRLMCKNLHILKNFSDTLHLQYNVVNNVMPECSLTPEVIHIILHHSSMYIKKLKLNHIHCLENIISLKYYNLTELSISGTVVEDTHLQYVAENCINLQSFSLKRFTKSKKQSNIRTNVFDEMKALNKLEIYDMKFNAWNYFDVQQLFGLGHLKTLMINIDISDSNDNNGNINNSTDRVYNIENLAIGVLLYPQSICFIKYLIHFENLTKLSITLKRGSFLIIEDNDLTQINDACPKLCELSFVECCFSFKKLPHLNNLMHLTFTRCWNVKLEKFEEIFQKLQLKSLSLVRVEMGVRAEDIFNYNYTSNTLETLNIEAISDRNIVRTFCNRKHKFKNVTKIRILENRIRRSQSTELYFSHNFPNLQELIMNTFHISSEDILYLKHLKILQFDLFDNMSWSYLEILFRHPALTHITITPFHCRDFEKYCEPLPNSCEGLTTKLEYLCLPSAVYERDFSFWSSFQQKNKLLKLKIVEY